MVQLVLQYRDYQRATQRLAGIPELLNKLRQVLQQDVEVWPVRGGVGRHGGDHDRLCGVTLPGLALEGHPACAACFPDTVSDVPLS